MRTIAQLKNFVMKLMQDYRGNRKLMLPTSTGMSFVKVSDILYCKASGNYTEIFLSGGKRHLVSRHIGQYEQLLNDYDFFRIHNSFLANMDHIQSYVNRDGGYVIMSDNVSLNVSRRRKESFLERMTKRSLSSE